MFPNPAAYGAAQYVPLGSEGSAFYSPLVSTDTFNNENKQPMLCLCSLLK
jgi:hypothetical protein